VGVLVCLGGGWQECAEVAERAKLAGHHALEVRSHLWVVWDISSWDLLLVVVMSCGAAVLLRLSVMAALRRASSVVIIVVVIVVVHMLVEG
jgi:hypothetical protein